VTKKKDPTFAEARARLLEILEEVEHDGGDVDLLVTRVKEAAELYRFCNDRLATARAQVSQVVADLEAAELAGAEAATAPAGTRRSAGATPAARGTSDASDDDDAGADDEDDADDASGSGRLPF
jgi:exodeoxyribonuclease VII small subunit